MRAATRVLATLGVLGLAAGSMPVIESALLGSGAGLWAEAVAVLPLTLALAGLWMLRRSPRPAPALLAHRHQRHLVLVAVAVVGPLVGMIISAIWTGTVLIPGPAVLLDTAVLATLEELLFRGLPLMILLALWRRQTSRWPTRSVVALSVVSSVGFALAHGDTSVLATLDRLGFALVASVLVVTTGRLLPAVALHVTSNLYWLQVAAVASPPGALIAVDMALMTGCAVAMITTSPRRRAAEELPPGEPTSAADRREDRAPVTA